MTPEEFFMYLIIALVILAPISARLYRRFTLHRATRLLHEQMNQSKATSSVASPTEPPR
ncbi:MAG TPA: hypothetical protein VM842_06410 [Nitrospira sp.]|jgi:predicted acetyltransferase|nr:hypothetical protein [Nitrospira sp.]